MPGRKHPETTESERDREYRTFAKRSGGETVAGEEGEGLEEKGSVGEVAKEREKWSQEHERPSRQDF